MDDNNSSNDPDRRTRSQEREQPSLGMILDVVLAGTGTVYLVTNSVSVTLLAISVTVVLVAIVVCCHERGS